MSFTDQTAGSFCSSAHDLCADVDVCCFVAMCSWHGITSLEKCHLSNSLKKRPLKKKGAWRLAPAVASPESWEMTGSEWPVILHGVWMVLFFRRFLPTGWRIIMGNTRIFDTDCFFGNFFILILYLYFINPINYGHLKLSSNILVMDQLNFYVNRGCCSTKTCMW